MKRKTEFIIEDLEESVYLLELDGFERIPYYIREGIIKLKEIDNLEKEIEDLKKEIQTLKSSYEKS